MISVPAIIETLGAVGVSIELAESGGLRLTPGSAVKPALKSLVLAHKPEISVWLAESVGYAQALNLPCHSHRIIERLSFNDPRSLDGLLEIPIGVTCAVFRSLNAARLSGCLQDSGQWSASANLQKGYWLAWLAGELRGVTAFSVRSLDA